MANRRRLPVRRLDDEDALGYAAGGRGGRPAGRLFRSRRPLRLYFFPGGGNPCDAQCCFSDCQQQCKTSYQLVYDTVLEKRWHTCYQTVHETVMKPVCKTCYRTIKETCYKNVPGDLLQERRGALLPGRSTRPATGLRVHRLQAVLRDTATRKSARRSASRSARPATRSATTPSARRCRSAAQGVLLHRCKPVCERTAASTATRSAHTICEQHCHEVCETVCKPVCETMLQAKSAAPSAARCCETLHARKSAARRATKP